MAIQGLFRPRWRHSRSGVCVQAVRSRTDHAKAACRSSQREVSDREDSAFDLVKTIYYCPLCSAEIGSDWSR